MSKEQFPDFSPEEQPHDAGAAALYDIAKTLNTEAITGMTDDVVEIAQMLHNITPSNSPRYADRRLNCVTSLPLKPVAELAYAWANHRFSAQQSVEENIRSSAIAQLFPDLAVEREFLVERPGVIFLPPRFNWYTKPITKAEKSIASSIAANNLGINPILTAEQAAESISRLQHDLPAHVSVDHRQRIFINIMESFISNLELYRLTEDPQGTVSRFTATPEEDLQPLEPGYQLPPSLPVYFGMLHPRLYNAFQDNWVTWWHRLDVSPTDTMSFHQPGRQRINSTVAELEATHYLALDYYCEGALVAIRTNTGIAERDEPQHS